MCETCTANSCERARVGGARERWSNSRMRRAPGLVEFSRREFCAFTAAAAGLALAACTDGGVGIVQTGALGSDPDAREDTDAPEGSVDARPGSPDARPGSPDAHPTPDAKPGSPDARPAPDASSGPVCTGSPTDVGAASAFTTGSPTYVSSGRFFVVRDSGGVYALTALCTHEGATCQVQSGEFYCPRHGATFTYDGAILGGPVSRPLVHYSMCVMSNGHLGVDTSTTVSSTTRLPV